jgi:anti-anti-sigma factor
MNYQLEIIKMSGDDDNKNAVYKLILSGEFTYSINDEFSMVFSDLLRKGIKKVIIDISNLIFIDSYGIGQFVRNQKMIQKENGEIIIASGLERVLNLLSIVNLNRLIKIFQSVEEGMNYFS